MKKKLTSSLMTHLTLSALVFSIVAAIFFPSSIVAEDLPREITVSTSERIWSGPSSARVSVEITSSANNATAAKNSNNEAASNLKASVGQISKDAAFETRGERFTGAGSKPGSPLTKGTLIEASLYIGIRLTKPEHVAAAIDAARKIPGCTVIDVDYYAPEESVELPKTVDLLSRRAKEKATSIANSLGAKLGPVLSVLLTEESDGSALRKQLQRPGDPSRFSDRERTLMLSTRFEIIPLSNVGTPVR
jgi:uncharacterized protein YggE